MHACSYLFLSALLSPTLVNAVQAETLSSSRIRDASHTAAGAEVADGTAIALYPQPEASRRAGQVFSTRMRHLGVLHRKGTDAGAD